MNHYDELLEPHLLLLGDTPEAELLGIELPDAFPGWRVSSPADYGDTDDSGDAADPEGATLSRRLTEHAVTAVVDASHEPQAATVRATVCAAAQVPYLRLRRPGDNGADGAGSTEEFDVASSVPEALMWLASVSAERAREQGRRAKAEAAALPDAGEALRELGRPLSGQVDQVIAALRAGQGVDVDNAAGWPLPDLGPSASPARSDAVARVLVTDMAPDVALQFTPGLPTLVVSAPSLVAGVQPGEQTAAEALVAHVRAVLADNLLASESLVALATGEDYVGRDDITGASAQLGVPVLGFSAETLAAAGGTVSEAAVVVAGARSVLPERTWHSGDQGAGSRVAVGRLAPVAV